MWPPRPCHGQGTCPCVGDTLCSVASLDAGLFPPLAAVHTRAGLYRNSSRQPRTEWLSHSHSVFHLGRTCCPVLQGSCPTFHCRQARVRVPVPPRPRQHLLLSDCSPPSPPSLGSGVCGPHLPNEARRPPTSLLAVCVFSQPPRGAGTILDMAALPRFLAQTRRQAPGPALQSQTFHI